MFDIESRETGEGTGMAMDAVTSYELEAMRRRETVASDRDRAIGRLEASETAEAQILEPRQPRRRFPSSSDCEPAQLARQPAG